MQWIPFKHVLRVIMNAKRNDWTWLRNNQCKYINVRIDMRDGACLLANRDGEYIDLKDLEYQYGPTKSPPGHE